jgi:hypothetical protein
MTRLNTLSILAGAIAVLAFLAAPASAIWISNSTDRTGTINILKAGEFKYPKANNIKCKNPAEIKAQWQMQGAGQIKQQQKIAKEAPHLQIQVKNWGKCEIDELLPAEISECDFQLVQQESTLKATLGVSKTTCVINVEKGRCVIQVPVGMEAPAGSGKGINVGLKEVELSNIGANQLDKVKITNTAGGQGQLTGEGLFATAAGPVCGILKLDPSTEEMELTGLEFEAEGVKAV